MSHDAQVKGIYKRGGLASSWREDSALDLIQRVLHRSAYNFLQLLSVALMFNEFQCFTVDYQPPNVFQSSSVT